MKNANVELSGAVPWIGMEMSLLITCPNVFKIDFQLIKANLITINTATVNGLKATLDHCQILKGMILSKSTVSRDVPILRLSFLNQNST